MNLLLVIPISRFINFTAYCSKQYLLLHVLCKNELYTLETIYGLFKKILLQSF